MAQMRCHYEVLGVTRDANSDDLKKAYRKLALQWHPDKNPDRIEECTREFLLIQQAYDVLVDPQERAWYDKHREAILRGGLGHGDKYEDDSLGIFQYFNSSCYSGFGDDKEGFYAVYSEVFQKLMEEDAAFREDNDEETSLPEFGDSQSAYDEIVGPFYAFWDSFNTAKSYVWVEKYDTREAPDRRVRRLMETENKKLRDASKKERNEEIRALVAFVRKRDKRVLAYRKKLEERAAEVEQKRVKRQKEQLKESQKMQENYQETEWSAMSGLECDMKQLEAHLADEFADASFSGSDVEEEEDEEQIDNNFCMACNKAFANDKSYANHLRSKKHKEFVSILRSHLEDDDKEFLLDCTSGKNDSLLSDQLDNNDSITNGKSKLSKKQKKKRKKQQKLASETADDVDLEDEEDDVKGDDMRDDRDEISLSDSLANKVKLEESSENTTSVSPEGVAEATSIGTGDVEISQTEKDDLVNGDVNTDTPDTATRDDGDILSEMLQYLPTAEQKSNKQKSKATLFSCNVCHKQFPTRNKMFQHVEAEGHALRVEQHEDTTEQSSKAKGKKNRKTKSAKR